MHIRVNKRSDFQKLLDKRETSYYIEKLLDFSEAFTNSIETLIEAETITEERFFDTWDTLYSQYLPSASFKRDLENILKNYWSYSEILDEYHIKF